MDLPNFEKIKQIVCDALEKPIAERAAFVELACEGDAAVLEEVQRLLKAGEAADAAGFMDSMRAGAGPPLSDFEAAALSEGPGTHIGAYKILQLIGQGGFGTVFMAEQERPVRRKVALKIIKLGMDTRAVVARFEAERQALAIMDHPNIAKVFDAGSTNSGRPYFVMELVNGEPITEYCDVNHLSVEDRLELFAQVCHAVQHAHQRGIIHRDIKPGNVLASTQDGRPFAKVIDFGIAKALADRLTEKTLFTDLRQFIGTPQYMSPEQAAGSLDIDTRTDVYSLGALLYELLTGSAPFDSKELRSAAYEEMRRIIREVEPPAPSTRLSQSTLTLPGVAASRRTEPKRLGGLVRGELDWIVMKAMEKDRSRRYESANALAEDLLRHRSGEAVIAAPPTAFYRLRKLVGRHKAALTAVAAIFLVLIAGVWVSTWEAVRASRARDVAQTAMVQAENARTEAESARVRAEKAQESEAEQRKKAEAALLDSQKAQAQGLVHEADALLLAGRWEEARQPTEEAYEIFVQAKLPKLEADLGLWTQNTNYRPSLMTFSGTEGPVDKIVISPDGRMAIGGGENQSPKLWDIATGNVVHTFPGHGHRVLGIAFSPKNHTALCSNEDKTLTLWDIDTGTEIRTFPGHGRALSIAFSPDGRTVLSGNEDKTLTLWDITTGSQLLPFPGHTDVISSVIFSPNARDHTALSGGLDKKMKLWDVKTGKEIRTFPEFASPVSTVAFSHDGSMALAGTSDGTLECFGIKAGDELWRKLGHTGEVLSVAVSADGRNALSGSADKTLKVWDITTGNQLRDFAIPGKYTISVAFSPDGRLAISGGPDGTLALQDIGIGKELRTFSGVKPVLPFAARLVAYHDAFHVGSVAFSPDGRTALFTSGDPQPTLWDLATGNKLHTFTGQKYVVSSVAFCPNDRTVLSGSIDGTMMVWDVATGVKQRAFSGYPNSPGVLNTHIVAFSPDGRTAISSGPDGMLKVRDLSNGAKLHSFLGPQDTMALRVAFSPDGHRALVGYQGGKVKLGDLATGKELCTFSGHRSGVLSVALSPDGHMALSSSADGTLELWDTATGSGIKSFPEQTPNVTSVAFSPDGLYAISGSQDGKLKLWDIATGKELRTFEGHSCETDCIAFSPDGRSALVGYIDATVQLWDFSRVDIYRDLQPRVEAAKRALQSNNEDTSALAILGQWYAFRGVDDWAAELLERARAGGAKVSALTLARCYWNLNKLSEARREFQTASAASNDPQEQFYLQLCVQTIENKLPTLPATIRH